MVFVVGSLGKVTRWFLERPLFTSFLWVVLGLPILGLLMWLYAGKFEILLPIKLVLQFVVVYLFSRLVYLLYLRFRPSSRGKKVRPEFLGLLVALSACTEIGHRYLSGFLVAGELQLRRDLIVQETHPATSTDKKSRRELVDQYVLISASFHESFTRWKKNDE